jgi:hypothetical protein
VKLKGKKAEKGNKKGIKASCNGRQGENLRGGKTQESKSPYPWGRLKEA